MSCWRHQEKVDLGSVHRFQQPKNEIKVTSGQRDCKPSRLNLLEISPVSLHLPSLMVQELVETLCFLLLNSKHKTSGFLLFF